MDKKTKLYQDIIKLLPKKSSGYSEYGSKVMPALSLYKKLTSFDDRKAFQDALEKMLTAPEENIRRFAVDICLGFFVFRDAG
jgi:hypothetical protein